MLEKLTDADEIHGVNIIQAALEIPARQIAQNAGMEGGVVVEKIRSSKSKNEGFDASKGEYVDMVKAGIIDPKKVTRSALENAASIASIFLTTEAAVADKPKKEADNSTPPMGMGGMGMGM